MAIEIKKTLFGKYLVVFDCPRCGERLRSVSNEIGREDDCPSCHTRFVVPGQLELDRFVDKENSLAERKARAAFDKAALKQEREEKYAVRKGVEAEEAAKERQKQIDEAARRSQLPLHQPRIVAPSTQATTQTTSTRRCPYCAEIIQIAALKCRHCGEFLDGRPKAQAVPVIVQAPQQGMGVCSLIFVIAFGIIAAIFIMALF